MSCDLLLLNNDDLNVSWKYIMLFIIFLIFFAYF